MAELYVPNYMSFNNDNIFLGSYEGLRFKLSPQLESQQIMAECWHGPLCYEKSQMEVTRCFPLTEEGIETMTQWLLESAAHPSESDQISD